MRFRGPMASLPLSYADVAFSSLGAEIRVLLAVGMVVGAASFLLLPVPTLTRCILVVITCCTCEEMRGVAAWRIVTMVEDHQAVWYRSNGQGPSESVRSPACAIDTNDAVAVIVDKSGPCPTSGWAAGAVDALPECIVGRGTLRRVGDPPGIIGRAGGCRAAPRRFSRCKASRGVVVP